MITPKEKAKELVDKFFKLNPRVKWDYDNKMWVNNYYEAKKFTLIAVDEIIDALDKSLIDSDIEWWQEVKQEIKLL
jgi:hypothetical protein